MPVPMSMSMTMSAMVMNPMMPVAMIMTRRINHRRRIVDARSRRVNDRKRRAVNGRVNHYRRGRRVDHRWLMHDHGRSTDHNMRQRDANVNTDSGVRSRGCSEKDRCEEQYFFHTEEQTQAPSPPSRYRPLIVFRLH